MSRNINILKGKRFGRLKVIKESGRSKCNSVKWLCKCDCGNSKVSIGSNLLSGNTHSCGCLFIEMHTKHGMARDRMYKRWSNINTRCYSKESASYKYYGGRGIKNYWRKDFIGFYNYVSKLKGYGKSNLTLDRINNNGDYTIGNLRWATKKEQNGNTRKNIILDGINASSASIKLGGSRSLVKQRINLGWSKKDAFTLPVHTRIKKQLE